MGSAILKLVAALADPELIKAELSKMSGEPRPRNAKFQFDEGLREVIRRRLGYITFRSTATLTSAISLLYAGLIVMERPSGLFIIFYFVFFLLVVATLYWIATHKVVFLGDGKSQELGCLILLCNYDVFLGALSIWPDVFRMYSSLPNNH